jgi:chorismate--pyruvate lyase
MKTSKEQFAQKAASERLSEWLIYSGSFMQRLKQHGVLDAKIEVLREGWYLPDREERMTLDMPFRTFAWVREVSIFSGDKVWMFARTVIPQETLTGEGRELQHLKTRSLGSVLFRYPDLQRSDFDYFFVKEGDARYKKISQAMSVSVDSLCARRSMFILREKSLLLTEVFFPEVGAL